MDKYRILRLNFHLQSDSQTDDMSITNIKKLKTDGVFFEMTFYREQPAPVPHQPQAPPPMAPPLDLDNFKAEMQAMMEHMMAGLIGKVREQVGQEVGHSSPHMEGELRDLKERLGVVEFRAGNKCPRRDQE